MDAVALITALVAGLAAGRLAAAVAHRFEPLRGARSRAGLVELAMAALLVAVVARFGVGWTTIPPLVAAVSLVTLSVVDWRSGRLPDTVTFPATGASLVAIGVASIATGRPGTIIAAVTAALGYGAVMWAAHELRPSGLGFGDVKFSPLLGLHLGWAAGTVGRGWTAVVALAAASLILSCLIGLAMGLMLGLLRRRGWEPRPDPGGGPISPSGPRLLATAFPFGPALSAGTMIAVLLPEALIL